MPASPDPNLVPRARDFAINAHGRIDQRRKYTREPYDVHLRAVAERVAQATDDPATIAAAWLHDVVEDTPTTIEDLEVEFGAEVAALVSDLTDPSRPGDGNRAARRALDRAHLARAAAGAQTIKLADLIDNCRSIAQHDPDFAVVFLAEAEDLLVVLERGDARLRAALVRTLAACRARLAPSAATAAAPEVDDPLLTGVDRDLMARHQRALRHFMSAFDAADLAEPLTCFDAETPAARAAAVLGAAAIPVAGVRDGDVVIGRVRTADLGAGSVGEHARAFRHGQLVDGDAPLVDVVHVLTRHEHCFVRAGGEVADVIGRHDLEKPAGRMWLFGIVTFTETSLRERVRRRWPDDAWTARLAPARLVRAAALRDERARIGQPVELLECVQLADLGRILVGDAEERAALGFPSKGAGERVFADLESLRNNLAHAQDIVAHDWAQIARMSQRLARIASAGS